MDGEAGQALGASRRCLFAVSGPRGPVLAPMAYWYDGASAWMSAPADSVNVHALALDPACAVWVAPEQEGGSGVVAGGEARVYSLRDPLAFAVHAPVLAAAVAALALDNVSSIAGYITGAARIPARRLPRNRVIVKVTLTDVEQVAEPALPAGIAPALPTVVPADVRRALAGRRRVVLAAAHGGRLIVEPAVWGAGFTLALSTGVRLPSGLDVTVALDGEGARPTQVVGLSLTGTLTAGPELVPERVTWWHGFDLATADVPPPATATPGAVTLPD